MNTAVQVHKSQCGLFTLQIFCAWAPDRLPPNTVKSCQRGKKCETKIISHRRNCSVWWRCWTAAVQLYLTEHVNQPAIDPAPARHHTVTWELGEKRKHILDLRQTNCSFKWSGLMSCGWSLCMTSYLVPVLLHAKVRAAVLHEHVRLHEGLWVQQKLDSLSGRQLPLRHTNKNVSVHIYSVKCLQGKWK